MKKRKVLLLLVSISLTAILYSCKTSECGCEYSGSYKQRKSKVSLNNCQKNTTFAVQKDIKTFYS